MASDRLDSAKDEEPSAPAGWAGRAAFDEELAACGLAWSEVQRNAVFDLGLVPFLVDGAETWVHPAAVALLDAELLVADSKAIADAKGRASLTRVALLDGDRNAAVPVRAYLRRRLEAHAVLGRLGEQLSLFAPDVLASLRGAARVEWRIRELLRLLAVTDGIEVTPGVTGRHAVPSLIVSVERVEEPLPDDAIVAWDGLDSVQTIPVVDAPRRTPAPTRVAGSPSTVPIPRAPDLPRTPRPDRSDALAIPESLRFLQGSPAQRRAIVRGALDSGRIEALENDLASGRSDDVDAFRMLVGDLLAAEPERAQEATGWWRRVAERSSAHTAAAMSRLAAAAVRRNDLDSAARWVEELALDSTDPHGVPALLHEVIGALDGENPALADMLLLRLFRLRVLPAELHPTLADRLMERGELTSWVEIERSRALSEASTSAALDRWIGMIEVADTMQQDEDLARRIALEALDACGRSMELARRLRRLAEARDDMDSRRIALTVLAESDRDDESLESLASLAGLFVSIGDEDAATAAVEQLLDKVPTNGAGSDSIHDTVMDALASVDRPDLRLRWLKRRAAASTTPEESYSFWAEIVSTLHGLPGYAGELSTAIDMALTLAVDADVDAREVLRLHALGLAAKARAPRWESAAWHATQVCDRRAALDTETAALLLEAIERAGGSVGVSAEALGVLQALADHAAEFPDARIVLAIGHGLLRAHQWEGARNVLERLVQRDASSLPQDVKARAYADLARAYEKLNAT